VQQVQQPAPMMQPGMQPQPGMQQPGMQPPQQVAPMGQMAPVKFHLVFQDGDKFKVVGIEALKTPNPPMGAQPGQAPVFTAMKDPVIAHADLKVGVMAVTDLAKFESEVVHVMQGKFLPPPPPRGAQPPGMPPQPQPGMQPGAPQPTGGTQPPPPPGGTQPAPAPKP
jgi:hypothetical protein